MQIHMSDLEQQRWCLLVEHESHPGDIAAAEYSDRRFAVTGPLFAAGAFTVQETLHERHEGDEFLVVPFLKAARIAELVVHFPPRAFVPHRLQ